MLDEPATAPGPMTITPVKRLLAAALLVSACGGAIQSGGANGMPGPSPTAGGSAPASSVPVASGSGYLAGLDAIALTMEAESRGQSCEEYSSDDPPTDQVWSCNGTAPDGSELFMHATGPDRAHLKSVSAQVLDYDTVKVGTITDYLGEMSTLFGRAEGSQARTWLLAAFPDAQRDGYVETDIGSSYFQLTFEDTGTSSATFLSVSSAAGPPVPTAGPLPSGTGAAFFGEVQGRPGGWVTFEDPGGMFSIAFPGQPTETGPQVTTGADGPISDTYYDWASSDRLITYAIRTTDYPEGVLSGQDPSVVLDKVADAYLAAFNAEPEGRSATTVGSHAALDVVETNVRGYICIRFVNVGDRLYVLFGTMTHQCPGDMAGFVGSFALKDG